MFHIHHMIPVVAVETRNSVLLLTRDYMSSCTFLGFWVIWVTESVTQSLRKAMCPHKLHPLTWVKLEWFINPVRRILLLWVTEWSVRSFSARPHSAEGRELTELKPENLSCCFSHRANIQHTIFILTVSWETSQQVDQNHDSRVSKTWLLQDSHLTSWRATTVKAFWGPISRASKFFLQLNTHNPELFLKDPNLFALISVHFHPTFLIHAETWHHLWESPLLWPTASLTWF